MNNSESITARMKPSIARIPGHAVAQPQPQPRPPVYSYSALERFKISALPSLEIDRRTGLIKCWIPFS